MATRKIPTDKSPGRTSKRGYNETQLYIDLAEERGIVHRDYIAHTLRWTHVLKHAKLGQRWLDLGCGDAPLAMTLYTNKYAPKVYTGVDIRSGVVAAAEAKLAVASKKFNVELVVADLCKEFDKVPKHMYDVVCCFEFVEHIPPRQLRPFLRNVQTRMGKKTMFFLSTPCYDGRSKAGNHVKEYTYEELRKVLDSEFTIEAVYGTFASQRDVVPAMTPAEQEVFASMHEYYDSNLLSIMFAPMHPAESRNAIWRLRKK